MTGFVLGSAKLGSWIAYIPRLISMRPRA